MPEMRILLTELALGESPRWHAGRLWLCDWVAHEILVVDPAGKREVAANIPALPFSIDFLPNGDLLVIAQQQLLRRERDGLFTTYADLTGLSPYGWNELVVDGRGNAYVNNVNFAFPGGAFAPGMLALVTPDGSVRQVADGVAFPNGMAVTPDNKTLILAESYGNQLTAFDIASDGSLSRRRVWADLAGGYPDGICLDAEGAVWYADVPNKRCVRVREGGEVLQTVELDRGCFACTLGGVMNRTLFLVAAEWGGSTSIAGEQRTGQVLSVEVQVPRAGWP